MWDGEGTPVRIRETKVRALLADLLAHEGRPVPADRLIHDLWGDATPGDPANALQAKVSQLRRALGRDRVTRQAGGYRLVLDRPGDEVDADRFRALAAAARAVDDPRVRAARLTEALDLWRGPAFADIADAGFARPAAERLDDQRLGVLEEQAEARLAAGEHALLAGELGDLVARHPLRERLRAVQMRALYRAGRQSEALASYAELRALMADELGIDPDRELAELHAAILRQDAALAPAPARPRLPVPLTALIGRDACLDEVAALVRSSRLVTLTGPGGVGKTRLALAAANRLAGAFPDGVWLAELGGRHGDAAVLAQAVADALGVRDDEPSAPTGPGAGPGGGTGGGTAPTADRLAAALRDRRLLLVLDNVEHVVEPAAALTAFLLRDAPGPTILATGREPLGLTGEKVYAVGPLGEADAVRLFTERAAASAPGFAPDEAGRAAVARICARLDGVPLALELAATRVRSLGVRELAARLGDRFGLLTGGPRDAPARQRTLRAVIDWSWDLLGADERAVLRRLAVPADGCDLDAAEAVCADGRDVRRADVLDVLGRLVDRSLVVMAEGAAGPRYRLLESVAAYAAERLAEAGETAATRDRHLRHYLALAERAEPHLRDAGQRAWLDRLDAESANTRAALGEALRRPAPDEAVRLATALAWWWLLRGRLHEARRTLDAVLGVAPDAAEARVLRAAFGLLTRDGRAAEAPEDGVADPVRDARARWFHAYALFQAGDRAGAATVNARALVRSEAAGDHWGVAAAHGLEASLALVRGDLATVGRAGTRAAELFGELGDRWGRLQTVSPLADLAEIRGDYAAAGRRQRAGLAIAEELGLRAEISARLSGLGRLALLAGDHDRARDLHERSLRLATEQGFRYGEVHALMGLALGARRAGDLDAAQRHLHRIRDEYESSDVGEHLLCAELGFVAELRGDAAGALAHHRRGMELACATGEPRMLALSLEGLAGALVLDGGAERAAVLLGAADAARRSVDAPLPDAERGDVDRIEAAAAAVLGKERFAAAFRRGSSPAPAEAAPPVT
ncbi:AfsR/SARP family transcriptional regulator [Actinomadura sp. WMMB 499]|nr:AfsR/SARP family transcriptional regulator [Actinomadura sp. WMMB 499]